MCTCGCCDAFSKDARFAPTKKKKTHRLFFSLIICPPWSTMLPSAPFRSGTRQNSRALGTSNITPYISVSGQLNCRYSVPSSSCFSCSPWRGRGERGAVRNVQDEIATNQVEGFGWATTDSINSENNKTAVSFFDGEEEKEKYDREPIEALRRSILLCE